MSWFSSWEMSPDLEPDLVRQLALIVADPESVECLRTLGEDLSSEVDQSDDPSMIGCPVVLAHGPKSCRASAIAHSWTHRNGWSRWPPNSPSAPPNAPRQPDHGG